MCEDFLLGHDGTCVHKLDYSMIHRINTKLHRILKRMFINTVGQQDCSKPTALIQNKQHWSMKASL